MSSSNEATAPAVSHKAGVHNKDLQCDVIQKTPNVTENKAKVHEPSTTLNPPFDSLLENPPTLAEIISYGDPSSDIHACVLNRYGEDPFFAKILESPGTFRNFEVSNRRIYMRNKGKRTLCIPDIKLKDRDVRELVISHAHSILAHLGPHKTLLYLRENVWWKT
ncbi:hypothetical protein P692DRAFT_201722659, partial [Suillus brevipes Sb2]